MVCVRGMVLEVRGKDNFEGRGEGARGMVQMRVQHKHRHGKRRRATMVAPIANAMANNARVYNVMCQCTTICGIDARGHRFASLQLPAQS